VGWVLQCIDKLATEMSGAQGGTGSTGLPWAAPPLAILPVGTGGWVQDREVGQIRRNDVCNMACPSHGMFSQALIHPCTTQRTACHLPAQVMTWPAALGGVATCHSMRATRWRLCSMRWLLPLLYAWIAGRSVLHPW
jgi:hypothetical protein